MNANLNFTSGRELQELFNRALYVQTKDEREELSKIIEIKLAKLEKRKNGAWGQPSSDIVYIELLNRLYNIISTNKELKNAINRLRAEAAARTESKVKAVFIAHEPSVWPSLDSVYHAMKNDNRYIVKAIYVPTYHQNKQEQDENEVINYYKERYGIKVIRENDYDMALDNPDLVFYLKPYDNDYTRMNVKFRHNSVLSTGARIIYISYGMETTRTFLEYNFQLPMLYHAWRHIVYGPIAKKCATKYGYRDGENVVVWGHPKADGILHANLHEREIPKEWLDKIKGRKTFMWNTHHTILKGGMSTWFEHGEAVLEYFKTHDDVVLLWRPHPLLFGALVNNNYMTAKELETFIKEVSSHENIILDTGEDYRPAFWVSDAAITDGTAFFGEYIYTEKPMIVTTNNLTELWLWRELKDCIPIATKTEDIFEFIDMVQRGEDKYKQARQQFRKEQYFLPENGTVGEYIRDQVYSDLVKELMPSYTKEKEDKEEKDKLVTVCILSYQNTEWLERAVLSVLNQDWNRIELIITDDCSDYFDEDGIRSCIEENKKSNLENYSIIRHDKNVGTVRNLRSAIEKMRGDYYITIGADDALYDNGTLTAYMTAAREMDHKPYMITGLLAMTEEKDLNKVLYTFPDKQEDIHMLMRGDARELYGRNTHWVMIPTVATCYRREIVNDYGKYDTDYMYLEDWPYFLKTLRDGHPPMFINRIMARHAMGGIANGNKRYKKDVRRRFIEDKVLLFEKEVINYIDILTPNEIKEFIKRITWEKKVYNDEIGVPNGQNNPFDALLDKVNNYISSNKNIQWDGENK